MKKTNWIAPMLFAAAAAVLRAAQLRTGFDESGLAVEGNLPGLLLIVVLVAAAGYAVFAARKLPSKRGECGELADCFRFEGNMPAVLCAVAGVFLVIFGAAASLLGSGSLVTLLLGMLAVAASLCVLYVTFALHRGNDVQGIALLVPVCCMVVYVILFYRASASDPVLARIYVEILAVAALTYSALERAAFAFRSGSPRLYLSVDAMAFVLAVTAAAELQSLSTALLFGGCALIELGFLCAAGFER